MDANSDNILFYAVSKPEFQDSVPMRCLQYDDFMGQKYFNDVIRTIKIEWESTMLWKA